MPLSHSCYGDVYTHRDKTTYTGTHKRATAFAHVKAQVQQITTHAQVQASPQTPKPNSCTHAHTLKSNSLCTCTEVQHIITHLLRRIAGFSTNSYTKLLHTGTHTKEQQPLHLH